MKNKISSLSLLTLSFCTLASIGPASFTHAQEREPVVVVAPSSNPQPTIVQVLPPPSATATVELPASQFARPVSTREAQRLERERQRAEAEAEHRARVERGEIPADGRTERTRLEISAFAGPGAFWVSGAASRGTFAVNLGVDTRLHASVGRNLEVGGVFRLQGAWDGEIYHEGNSGLWADLGASLRLHGSGDEEKGFRFGAAVGLSIQQGFMSNLEQFTYDDRGGSSSRAVNQTAFGPFGNITFDHRFNRNLFVGFGVTTRFLTADFNREGNLDWFTFDGALRVGGDLEL